MSGSVIASSGRISNFTITSGSIDSNSSNSKRGLKLEPGESIRGYGNTAHTTKTVEGMFSFGVASVSPPVGSDGNRLLFAFIADDLTLLQAQEPKTP